MTMTRGCIIVTLGTPASPQPKDIQEFLKIFLSDPAVVDMPRWLWKPILHNIVLRVRPEKIAPIYRRIWTAEGSPLLVHTRAQNHHLAQELEGVRVAFATTYMEPSIASVIAELDVDEVVVIPLYPQYTPSTVADIWRQLDEIATQPDAPRIIRSSAWYDNPAYIDWYVQHIHTRIKRCSHHIDKIIFSYHGVPLRAAHDPREYQRQCEATTQAIMDRVGTIDFEITYQSKFGPGAWLQPATIERMAALPGEGVQNIMVVTPGFFASCIETLDEIDVLNQEKFISQGGCYFTSVAPPDSDPVAGKILAHVYHSAIADNPLK
ncbi:ferrochelatase [Arcanobacterium buesumense]|uniref:Coproporphyrin III ferrochelatase n=2 Tax=Arcanobacterium buesumense TaxID=2722751 RepID=A0A6H2ELX2_9ACTO|nr:ferrochelatase [Arcanobacterium buesumense]